MRGRLTIVVTAPDGSVKDEQTVENLVVTTGKNYVASRMAGTSANVMSHMAIGTGSTAAAAADTTLGTESARVSLTSTTNNNNDVVYVATFPANTPASAAAITEAGLFNASSGGTMLCRTVFAQVNKQTADALTITWTVTAS
jgi:hypothetical protein|tara:strand:- start:155 stop:580 length:426 start_codon:yes stop_codon:yes gene_type:complete